MMLVTRYFLSIGIVVSIFALAGFLIGGLSVLPFLTLESMLWLPFAFLLQGIIGTICGLIGGLIVSAIGGLSRNRVWIILISLLVGAVGVGVAAHYLLSQIHSLYKPQLTSLYVCSFALGFLIFQKRIYKYLRVSGA